MIRATAAVLLLSILTWSPTRAGAQASPTPAVVPPPPGVALPPRPAAAAPPAAQREHVPLLALYEDDPDGQTHALGADTASVDVGSTIRLELRRDGIAAAAPTSSSAATEFLARLSILTEGLAQVTRAMPAASNALTAWTKERSPENLSTLQTANRQLGAAALGILDVATAPGGQRLRAVVNRELETLKAPNNTVPDQVRAVVRSTEVELEALRRDLETVLRADGVSFLLGGWLVSQDGSRPIHIEGFDSYAPGERAPFNRWKIALDAQQQDQLRKDEALTRDINAQGLAVVARAQGELILQDLLRRTSDAAQQVVDAAKKLGAGGGSLGNVRTDAEETAKAVVAYGELLRGLLAKYQDATPTPTSGADLLVGTNADMEQVIERAKPLVAQVQKTVESIRKLAAKPPDVQALLGALERLGRALNEDVLAAGVSLQAFFGVAKVNSAALRFGEQVRKVALEDLPASATIDLDATGRRAPGDSVVLKLAVARGDSEPVPLEVRRMLMRRIVPYIETTAGLIFAQTPEMPGVKGRFQAAAAYSVLLKRGSRVWGLWNTLLSPGIGVNLSALDFNHDNTPEVGIAATVSLFRDILQAGYGYNVFDDHGYFFFGVGLPLPSFGGPSVSTTSGSSSSVTGAGQVPARRAPGPARPATPLATTAPPWPVHSALGG